LPYIICADILEPNLGSINMKDSRKGNTKDLWWISWRNVGRTQKRRPNCWHYVHKQNSLHNDKQWELFTSL